MKITRERDERKTLGLTKPQQQKWDFIVNKKGADYLLTAVAHAFKSTDSKRFDQFIQDLFIKLSDDYASAKKMRDNRDDGNDELEVVG